MAKKKTDNAEPKPKKTLKITQIRSGIGFDNRQELALRGLGLRRIRHTVERVDTPETRGLILKVRHLVTVEGE
jgi:large subunit ribosomal protein L30